MALTTTTAASATSASASTIKLTAYTAPSGRAKPLLEVDDEIMLIVDTANSPTLGVVRGYMGTLAVAHSLYAGVTYGAPSDFQVSKGSTVGFSSLANPTVAQNVQQITATGATGTTAATITQSSPAFLTVTGASGSGVNLPVPVAGAAYTIINKQTGALLLYSVGATINGTTGTTAFTLTATGNLMAWAFCTTAGAWQVGGNT